MAKILLASTALPLLMLVAAAAPAASGPLPMLAQATAPQAAPDAEGREERRREERPRGRRAREHDAGAQGPQDAGPPPRRGRAEGAQDGERPERRERAADQPDRPGRPGRADRPARQADDPARRGAQGPQDADPPPRRGRADDTQDDEHPERRERAADRPDRPGRPGRADRPARQADDPARQTGPARSAPADPPAASEAAPASSPPEPMSEPPRAGPETPAAPDRPPVAAPAAPETPAEPPAVQAPPSAPAPAAEPPRPAAEPRRFGPPDREPGRRGFRGFADPRSPEFERFAPGARRGPDRDARIDDLRRSRRERIEDGGRRVIIEEPDRVIIREGDRYIVRHDETDRFRRSYRDADVRIERRGAEEITIVRRPNGIEIVTVRDPEGRLLRRIRRHAGVETVLIDNTFRDRPRRGGLIIHEVVVPPPQVQIAREHHVVELRSASPAQIYEVFTAPPVAQVDRAYTLDEVRQSRNLREYVRRVDVDMVTFDFGSWQLGEDQIPLLAGVAEAMRRALESNPDEIFLIEGHTDAVGSEVDNLTLADRRAETVAMILTDHFGIPAENLTTQGYGEQFLKIDTQAAERRNRRVEIRRITPLLQGQARR